MNIPKEVKSIIEKLQKARLPAKQANYEAYIVGGCVRDLLLGKKPKDWDITTNAKPKEIQKIFPKSFYANKFGTVTVQTGSKDKTLIEIEVTTYRIDEKYSDKRHPDKIRFAKTIEEDLKRRDFTINALALDNKGKLVDLFDGEKDLKKKIIRAVGNPEERFNEDALRMLRAVRFATTLSASGRPAESWKIEPKTLKAIQKNAGWIQAISKERIRDELIKIIESEQPKQGIELLRKAKLLQYILPELEKGAGVGQNKYHIYDIYEHSIRSLQAAADQGFNLDVRLAALFHDIGKPETKEGEGPDSTFYNHDYVGAKFTARILERLKFPKKFIEKVAVLVRNHMFVSDPDRITDAGVRRLIRRIGLENTTDIINLRVADRLGMGVPKAKPYRLRTIEYMMEKVSKDPISVKMLKIGGSEIMKILKIEPGPKIGAILDVLLSEAIEDPKKNIKNYLEKRIKELNKTDLEELRKMAKKKIEEKKEEEDLKIKGKYWIK